MEEEEWVFYLTSNLKGKYKILMQGLTVDDEEDYQTVKGRLLEAAGFTTKEAGAILMALSTDFRRGMTALQHFQMLLRLIKRMCKGVETVNDCYFAMLLPAIKRTLPREGVAFLDQKDPKSIDELLDAIQAFQAIEKVQAGETAKQKSQSHGASGFGPPRCFHCQKPGHRANECRLKAAGEPPRVPMGGRNDAKVTCYNCGKQGHRANFCPEKASIKPAQKIAAKRARSWRTTNEYVVSGIVGEKVHDFVLDTGACVCIVPESCVNEEEYLQDMLVVVDANGHTERRRIAKKRLQIKRFDEEIEVAVAPDEVLGGKAIFSINLGDPLDWEILCKNVQGGVAYPVKAVSTRAVVKERIEAEVNEARQLALDKPKCTAPVVGPAQPIVLSAVVSSEPESTTVAEVSSVEDAEKSAGSVVEVLDEVDLGGVIDGYTPGKEVIWDVDKSSSTGCEQEDMIELGRGRIGSV